MFKDNTVFVVGAGASSEFGLPIGWELLQTIKTNSDFTKDRWGQVTAGPAAIFTHYDKVLGREDPEKIAEFALRLKACFQINQGIESADSIDEYIYRYSHDPIIGEVGKLQIAYAISMAERRSTLSPESGFHLNPDVADNTWIWGFTKALINGIRADQMDEIGKNITIICFNYDRCIEHYLEIALVRSFHELTPDMAREIVSKINIVHPYGWLGDLGTFPFGAAEDFPLMAENLITWSESVRDPEIVAKMKKAIREANQIVFMGFGFAAQNLDLLNSKPEISPQNNPYVYSTGLGLREETESAMKKNIIALYSNAWTFEASQLISFQYGAKCKEFFDIQQLNLVK